jgi:hypothetical protein
MSRETPYWDEIIERYKVSGLTQVEFCKRNNLLLNHFLYRWHEKRKALERRAGKAVSSREKNKDVSSFESVVLAKPSPCTLQENSLVELTIHLPNHIRCVVKTSVTDDGISSLLKQVMKAC